VCVGRYRQLFWQVGLFHAMGSPKTANFLQEESTRGCSALGGALSCRSGNASLFAMSSLRLDKVRTPVTFLLQGPQCIHYLVGCQLAFTSSMHVVPAEETEVLPLTPVARA
jgi:hypothetical protein